MRVMYATLRNDWRAQLFISFQWRQGVVVVLLEIQTFASDRLSFFQLGPPKRSNDLTWQVRRAKQGVAVLGLKFALDAPQDKATVGPEGLEVVHTRP